MKNNLKKSNKISKRRNKDIVQPANNMLFHHSLYERKSRGMWYSGYRYYQQETDYGEKFCVFPIFKKKIKESVTKTYPTKKFVETILYSNISEYIKDIQCFEWNDNKSIAGRICIIINEVDDYPIVEKKLEEISNQCGYHFASTFKVEGIEEDERVFQYEPLFQNNTTIYVNDYIYQITTKNNFEKIKKYGFSPRYQCKIDFKYPCRVYFFNTFNIELFKLYIRESKKENLKYKNNTLSNTNEYVIIEVDIDKIDTNMIQFFKDPNFGTYSLFTYSNIPSSVITDCKDFVV